MESVHRSSFRSWIDNNVVDVRQFQCEYHNAIKDKISSDRNDLFLKNIISTSDYSEIERQCSVESMQCDFQERVEMSTKINLPTEIINDLDTLRSQDEELKKRHELARYASAVYNNQKYCNFPHHKILGTKEDEEEDDSPYEPIKTSDVLLSVQIFMPERKQEQNSTVGRAKVPSFQVDQEFLVLGSQYLTELRDKIECISDRVIPGDFSDYPIVEQPTTCKDLYKSGFFYINGTFYNDMRDNDCSDYSEVIIEWAGKEKRGIGPFKKAIMEETKFVDLKVQLGYPYVYLHQGECEHLLVFTELRMFTKHDINNRNAYPLYVNVKPMKRFICMICHFYASKWVVYDNKRLPENPFFFCQDCFFSFNYDKNNQKIGSFRAYHYPDEAKLM